MVWTASHVGFVAASYGISAACIAALILVVIVRDRRNQKALAQFDRTKP